MADKGYMPGHAGELSEINTRLSTQMLDPATLTEEATGVCMAH